MSLFSRTDQSLFGQWWWTVDRMLLVAVLVLAFCGVIMVTTASPPVAERIGYDSFHFITRHLIFLGPSLLILLGMSLLSPRWVWRIASIVLLGSIAAMILVLFVGVEVKGAQRWLHIFGFSLQPSEFIKPSFAVVAAWFMSRQKDNPAFPGNMISAGLFGIVIILLLLQPDFGMTVLVSCIYGAQVFLAGLPLWMMAIMGAAAIAGLFGVYFTLDHVKSRIDRFLDPDSGDTYQVDKALEAFREGGVIGSGPGQGTVKLSLPDAHADFIFAVGAEEMGLFFAVFLVGLFAFILLRGFNRIIDSDNMFIVLATGGLLVMFGLQAFIHMGSNVSLLPAKGMTLPFISYGGSSLLAIGFTMGIGCP